MLRVLHFLIIVKWATISFKVHPIFDICDQKFELLDLPQPLSVDEAMVPYHGRHSSKQYMRKNQFDTASSFGLAEKCDLRSGHCLVFYNFFTGLPLMSALQGLGGTGTARDNRIGKPGLMSAEKMKKMLRETSSATLCEDVAVIRWKDNKPVTIVSNIHGFTPRGKCSRWSRQERRKVTLDLPALP